jgi:hypothetical protein
LPEIGCSICGALVLKDCTGAPGGAPCSHYRRA